MNMDAQVSVRGSLFTLKYTPGEELQNHTVLPGFPGGTELRRPGFRPWGGKTPWRRGWQPAPGLLPGELHRQRSLVGRSPWGCRELGTTEATAPRGHSTLDFFRNHHTV